MIEAPLSFSSSLPSPEVVIKLADDDRGDDVDNDGDCI